MFGRRSGAAVGAVGAGIDAARAGGNCGFAGAGPAGVPAGGLPAGGLPAVWAAALWFAFGLAGSCFAAAGFVAGAAFGVGWEVLLPCIGLACVAGAAAFFATVVCVALAAGFAAARCGEALGGAAAPRSDRAVPAVAFIPDTFFLVPHVSRSVRRSARATSLGRPAHPAPKDRLLGIATAAAGSARPPLRVAGNIASQGCYVIGGRHYRPARSPPRDTLPVDVGGCPACRPLCRPALPTVRACPARARTMRLCPLCPSTHRRPPAARPSA